MKRMDMLYVFHKQYWKLETANTVMNPSILLPGSISCPGPGYGTGCYNLLVDIKWTLTKCERRSNEWEWHTKEILRPIAIAVITMCTGDNRTKVKQSNRLRVSGVITGTEISTKSRMALVSRKAWLFTDEQLAASASVRDKINGEQEAEFRRATYEQAYPCLHDFTPQS